MPFHSVALAMITTIVQLPYFHIEIFESRSRLSETDNDTMLQQVSSLIFSDLQISTSRKTCTIVQL
jgi:hypothetical protein